MKKIPILDLNRILQIALTSLIIYCLLSITRSSSLLYIAYTDNYFYNFDFDTKLYMQKSVVFNNAYYFCTYITGFFLAIFLKKILKLNWLTFIFSLVVGFVLFRLVDSNLIRPLFSFFENPRMNIVLHLLTFLILALLLIKFFYNKYSYNSKMNNPDGSEMIK
jgi:hypothetical protein